MQEMNHTQITLSHTGNLRHLAVRERMRTAQRQEENEDKGKGDELLCQREKKKEYETVIRLLNIKRSELYKQSVERQTHSR
jgi:hypothetical protein